jgi:co-chaperonin GroES (HSP10)
MTAPNPSGIFPSGWRLVIEPAEVEEVSRGGIILFTASQKDKEALAQMYGRVVAVGPECWKDSAAPWAVVGDRIIFGRYSGLIFTGEDGGTYRVINDTDVVAVANYNLSEAEARKIERSKAKAKEAA